MIAPISSFSSAAPLRPITVMPMGCQCMECAPQRVMEAPAEPVAAPAPSIETTSNVSPALSIVAQAGAAESGLTASDKQKAAASTTVTAEKTPAPSEGVQEELTQEEKAQIAKLQARDREVRAHEQAHAAAGAGLAGAPSYTYQQGPDGRQYAVGGEVSIKASTSSSNPRQAIQELQQMARAALAPASPSGQDRAVAAAAQQQVAQLQAQLAQETRAKAQEALQKTDSGAAQTEAADASESKPLLPELPGLPSASEGSSDRAIGNDRPAASVVEPPAPRGESTSPFGAIAISISRPVAAYQQANDNASGKNALAGRIFSLNT
jgi:hypothetical protein